MIYTLDGRRGEVGREALASGGERIIQARSERGVSSVAGAHLVPYVAIACNSTLGAIDDEHLAVGGEDCVSHQTRFREMLNDPSSRDSGRVEDHSDDLVGCRD